MGPGKYENVGESQSVLIMNDPTISTRTRDGSLLRSFGHSVSTVPAPQAVGALSPRALV
jgi:hypothetical protein